MIEIAKAISTNAKIIIMDELLTAALSKRNGELYTELQNNLEMKVFIIFISHRFEDMPQTHYKSNRIS